MFSNSGVRGSVSKEHEKVIEGYLSCSLAGSLIMVLLTSSSISVAISSTVVCVFTFLLFLSGYVLQQQSVRSLQAALHPPPKPTPTLPVYFQDVESNATKLAEATSAESKGVGDGTTMLELGSRPTINVVTDQSMGGEEVDKQKHGPSLAQHTALDQSPTSAKRPEEEDSQSLPSRPEGAVPSDPLQPQNPFNLAYIQSLAHPSHICSALLFFKYQSEHGDPSLSRILSYPSYWEEFTTNEAYTGALALMRLAVDELKIILYPIKVKEDTDSNHNIERQLISTISSTLWPYDGLLYLRIPGLALDISALDKALLASQHPSLRPKSWAPLPSQTQITRLATTLLITSKGAFTPRGSGRRLVAEAMTSHANHHEQEMDVEAAARTAAYVVFEEGELEHRRTEKEWYGGVFERFERGRGDMCKGVNFEGKRGN